MPVPVLGNLKASISTYITEVRKACPTSQSPQEKVRRDLRKVLAQFPAKTRIKVTNCLQLAVALSSQILKTSKDGDATIFWVTEWKKCPIWVIQLKTCCCPLLYSLPQIQSFFAITLQAIVGCCKFSYTLASCFPK